jgi:hypothetical protein
MNVQTYQAEAHDQAAVEFANALRKTFPSIAERITEDSLITFQGTLKGKDVLCTFNEIGRDSAANNEPRKYSRHYDPTDPEVKERRKKLFERINAAHSEESLRAFWRVAHEYSKGEGEAE